MISRTWTTGVDPNRAHEYEAFARDISLPMFQSHPECCGVIMERHDARCRVTTFWTSREGMTDFEASERYRDTVARIVATGFLNGEQSVIVDAPHIAWLRSSEA